MQTLFVGSLMYFGALLVPLLYFAITRMSGKIKRRMLIGTALQLFWSLMVWAFVWYSWRRGDSEYYWGWALLIPVNAVAFVWYVGCLLWPVASQQNKSQ